MVLVMYLCESLLCWTCVGFVTIFFSENGIERMALNTVGGSEYGRICPMRTLSTMLGSKGLLDRIMGGVALCEHISLTL